MGTNSASEPRELAVSADVTRGGRHGRGGSRERTSLARWPLPPSRPTRPWRGGLRQQQWAGHTGLHEGHVGQIKVAILVEIAATGYFDRHRGEVEQDGIAEFGPDFFEIVLHACFGKDIQLVDAGPELARNGESLRVEAGSRGTCVHLGDVHLVPGDLVQPYGDRSRTCTRGVAGRCLHRGDRQ